MVTKSLTRQSVIAPSSTQDSATMNRLLVAAVISPRFRGKLLSDSRSALHAGFNGEYFPLSQPAYSAVTSIKANTLSDFIRILNEKVPFALV